ncbi:hypothetical protein [Ancylomarina sp. 16SWW S1-10-2]|uniref:hypothetical protein n=1 Tax=Ancylomarina sp. 16SWW S1-10-2 TaxID=2499681 RepID=UPI0012AE4469|nr:hypothetical protein [Ancylomarina sp. 16SWW S1-10-2]MRT91439.1 hypothetical protein [Ancylomarina sp. 16SWW S1-10-2]
MYKIISFLSILMLYTSLVFAQGNKRELSPEMRAKFEAQKISYITQQLDISPEKAQLFWPLYNEMKNKKDSFHNEFRQLFRQIRQDSDNLSEKELAQISDRIADLKVEKATMERDYHYKFKKVLSAKQILNLYEADKGFQKMLLRRIKGNGNKQREK